MPASYPFWLGGVAASMAACCTHPLDLAKVRMQTVHGTPGAKPANTLNVLVSSIQQHGFRSLYTGLSASVMRQMSYSLVRLGAYEKIKSEMSKDGTPSTAKLLLAASTAGVLGGFAGNPADILLVRMTSDAIKPPELRYGYKNVFHGLYCIIKEEGFKGLYRGIEAATARAILMNASQVVSYDYFKTSLLANPIPIINYQLKDNLLLHAVSSCLAGTIATTVCSPADVLKSRIMASTNHSLVEVFTSSLSKEGPMFLFRGWTPAFIRLAPNTVFLFVFFEQLKKGWNVLTT